jgi:hypothetical protein
MIEAPGVDRPALAQVMKQQTPNITRRAPQVHDHLPYKPHAMRIKSRCKKLVAMRFEELFSEIALSLQVAVARGTCDQLSGQMIKAPARVPPGSQQVE